jgi:hypothetical protein
MWRDGTKLGVRRGAGLYFRKGVSLTPVRKSPVAPCEFKPDAGLITDDATVSGQIRVATNRLGIIGFCRGNAVWIYSGTSPNLKAGVAFTAWSIPTR